MNRALVLSRKALGGPGFPTARLPRLFKPRIPALQPALEEGITFVLLLFMALTVVWSVERADWTPTPPLGQVLLLGMVAGWLLAKVRLHAAVLLPPAMLVGAATLAWYGTQLVDAGPLSVKAHVLQERLALWYAAAVSGGISTDTVPFGLVLVALSWLLGCLCAWSVSRWRNEWVAILAAGFGLLTNLSYLSSYDYSWFFVFLLLALLLFGWMGIRRREEFWRQLRVRHSQWLGVLSLHDAFWFAFILVVVVALLPVRPARLPALRGVNEYLRWPVEQFRGDFHRLFAGLPARKPMPFRVFDATLPFQGTISLSDDVVFSVKTSRPVYLRARSYPVYTSKGWVAGATQIVPMASPTEAPGPPQYQRREEVKQRVTLNFSTQLLMAAGLVQQGDRPLEVETPVLPTYGVVLEPGVAEPVPTSWPQDVKELARSVVASQHPVTEARLRELLPPDLILLRVERGADGSLLRAIVQRSAPPMPDILSVRGTRRLSADSEYAVTSSISVATPQELRHAGEVYPAWVRDIYLQLPETLPERVGQLARDLSRGADNPYDKALAIGNYLRGFTYTLGVPPPAFDADGVDHFLFGTRAGYSDYFASAMAVMLRAVGVPARLAAGYGSGEEVGDDLFLVRDRNSHAWTEVFFPGFGWVEFEPTPGRQEALYPVTVARTAPSSGHLPGGSLGGGPEEEEQPGFLGIGSWDAGTSTWAWLPWLLAALAATLLGTAVWLGARWLVAVPISPQGVYARMALFARWAGLAPAAAQTPLEYSRALGLRMPRHRRAVARIVSAYVRASYGRRPPSAQEQESVRLAWAGIRGSLLLQSVRRWRRE